MTASPQNLPPADPHLRIPPAVQARIDRANELMRPPEPAPAPAEPPAPAPAEPQEPQVTPPGNEDTFQAPAPASEAPKPDDWEHRYKSLKGRFDRMESDNRTLQADLHQSRRDNAVLQAQVAPTRETQFEAKRLITPEEETEYGEEFLAVVGKRAQEITAPLMAELQDLRKKVGSVSAKTEMSDREKFFQDLTSTVGNWREINKNPDFIQWLSTDDPYSGQRRQDMLDMHVEKNNAAKAALFFQGFLRETTAVTPLDEPKPDPKKIPLEALAAPGRAKSSAAPSAPGSDEPLNITPAFIAQHYSRSARGYYKGNEDEYQRIEKAIFRSQQRQG